MPTPHRVLIVGGGFGGLYAAQALRRAPVELTLVDRRNFHLFQPLLYQVATGGLSPANIAAPLRAVLRRQKNARVLLGEVTSFDPARRRVLLSDGTELAYDSLVVAAGVGHSYFGHDEWAAVAPALKTIEDATEIRRRILLAFEAAERETDPARRRAWLTFVIVGGGPTGVELAGTLGEIAQHTLSQEFRSIDPSEARILLVEGLDRVLPPYPAKLSAAAALALERRKVTVRTDTRVVAIDAGSVTVKSGEATERIPARTVVWAAGVRASPLGRALADASSVKLDAAGRVLVEPDLTIAGHPEVFVIGDLATFTHQTGKPLPGVAQVAMQQGRYVADLIRRRVSGDTTERPFHYQNRGDMAVLGRGSAVADVFGRLRVSGFFAWLLWLFIHLMYLVEFDNRVLVFLQWAWSYFTWDRGARLITGNELLPERGEARRGVA
jgi:NADH dehydrogenase